MFKRFTKKGSSHVLSPVDGTIIPITDVKDEMFSNKMLGDGFAVKPSSDKIHAPIKGKIVSIFPTLHAIGMVGSQGEEILVHIGIDTVTLEGVPFNLKVEVEDEVEAGDLLVIVDFGYIEQKKIQTDVIVVFTNNDISFKLNHDHLGDQKQGCPVGNLLLV